ncbi:adenine-specific DNA methyltransferase [Campylobacter iguaniorum]|uniref:DNA adenine methylase n=1 Tax=Campylobacter iguaniorum TaxID=1244531 RepID=UPI0007C917E4|nr:DNA adenine methylase [Campylobacter iguaniorum]ANE36553.1 adenine-specific DNA methyltransferase [Campylobacter iguaniorum]
MLSTFNISSRRYLGNKTKLLPFIKEIVEKNCTNITSVADIFAGTGAVASAFTNKKIITNDILQSNYLCNIAWFSPQKYNKVLIEKLLREYNAYDKTEINYMSANFSNTYFKEKICSKIGFIREDIENLRNNSKINQKEKAILVASLIYAMDRIATTCGHYDAYRKNGKLADTLTLAMPLLYEKINTENRCFNKDANELVKEIEADLVYIDPPYNSRQYCDAYHLLENVAVWKKQAVYGIARKMNRDNIKSEYCKHNAGEVFADLIRNIKARYILLSYNNMAIKGNARSNARISDETIMRVLEQKGQVKVFSQEYKAFNTGKSSIQNNAERLFLCKVR